MNDDLGLVHKSACGMAKFLTAQKKWFTKFLQKCHKRRSRWAFKRERAMRSRGKNYFAAQFCKWKNMNDDIYVEKSSEI